MNQSNDHFIFIFISLYSWRYRKALAFVTHTTYEIVVMSEKKTLQCIILKETCIPPNPVKPFGSAYYLDRYSHKIYKFSRLEIFDHRRSTAVLFLVKPSFQKWRFTLPGAITSIMSHEQEKKRDQP